MGPETAMRRGRALRLACFHTQHNITWCRQVGCPDHAEDAVARHCGVRGRRRTWFEPRAIPTSRQGKRRLAATPCSLQPSHCKAAPPGCHPFGQLNTEDSFVKNGTVFGMVRVKKGSPGYLYLVNLGSTLVETNLADVKYLPGDIRVLDGGSVAAVAPHVDAVEGEVALKKFPTNAVPLEPGQAKIFNFVPKFTT